MALTQISTKGIKDGTITGSDLATNVDLVDNQKLRLGASQDLEIFHDGSNSYLKEVGTGSLLIWSIGSEIKLLGGSGAETLADFNVDGGVELYHDNNKKFETITNGAKVIGNLVLDDNNEIRLGSDATNGDLQIYHNGTDNFIDTDAGSIKIRVNANENAITAASNGAVELYHDNSKKFETTSYGNLSAAQVRVASSNASTVAFSVGDVGTGFYNTGSNAIGYSANGTQKWNIDSGGNLRLVDNVKANFGTSDDLQIYHDGSNSYIKDSGTGDLLIGGDANVSIINSAASEFKAKFITNGAVELYHDNVKKFETTSTGVNMPSGTAVFGGVSGTSFVVEVNPISSLPYGLNVREPSGASAGYPLLQVSDDAGQYFFRVLSGGKAQANTIEPKTNNSFNLGSSSKRWSVVFAANAFNTSDKNLKNTVLDSDLGLSFVNKLRPVSYKWNQKQEENLDSKTHYGFIAQEIETALISENKTLDDFAGVYKPDNYKEDGTGDTMAISTNEILSPLVKAVQELSNKVKTLETEVASLKAS